MSDELCPGCPGDPNENCCKPELRVKVWMDKQKADMTDQKTEQKPEHEKRIREALASGKSFRDNDLRALLADLDAVRGALERISCAAKATVSNPEWIAAHADAALKGATA